MPQDEPDLHNFSTSPDHRLPPITGAEGLQNEIERARGISTGLVSLDLCLSPHGTPVASNGIRRGCVTEIYGPPGSGKSAIGMQIAANSVKSLGKAVWLAAGTPLMQSRLDDIAKASKQKTDSEPPSSPQSTRPPPDEEEHDFVYRETHSLSHLLVMLMHPTTMFPPPNTATIIVDGLPNMLMSAFPRQLRGKDSTSSILKENAAKAAAGKRHQMIENLAGALSHLALSRQIAIIVLNKTTTSMKGGQRALLKPSIGGQAWDAAVHTRIVLYRDLYPRHLAKKLNIREKRFYRLAEVVRLAAKDVGRDPVPFVIETGGLRELPISGDMTDPTVSLPGADLLDDPPLQIRTSQPETRTTVPLITQDTFPTASQIFRNESSQPSQATPVPLPPQPPNENTSIDENEPQSSQTRPSKRKAVEIADSEDEDEDDEEKPNQAPKDIENMASPKPDTPPRPELWTSPQRISPLPQLPVDPMPEESVLAAPSSELG